MTKVKFTLCHFKIEGVKLSFFRSKEEAFLEREEDVDNLVKVMLQANNNLLWISYSSVTKTEDSDLYESDIIYADDYELAEP